MGELSFNELINLFEVQAIIRIILGALLAGLIGYERQAWKKPAGFRTHILVGESAVLVTLCGIYLSEKIGGVDATRIPAQLLSGMGFIGAPREADHTTTTEPTSLTSTSLNDLYQTTT